MNATKPTKTYLSVRDVRSLIDTIPNARDQLMVRLLYESGCSISELVSLRVSDVGHTKIKVREQGGVRFCSVSRKLAKDVSLFCEGNKLAEGDFVFSTRQSDHISEKRVRQLIHMYTRQFDEKLNPQLFRYYHIAHAYLNGVFIETIARQVGLTTYRIFQILEQFSLKPNDSYHKFLKRV